MTKNGFVRVDFLRKLDEISFSMAMYTIVQSSFARVQTFPSIATVKSEVSSNLNGVREDILYLTF